MSISKQPLNHSIMQQIINLTDRSVDIGRRTILRSGTVAVVTIRETSSEFDGVTVVNRELGEVEGLPPFDPKGEVLYVVDPLVQRALPDRPDLVTVRESGKESSEVHLARIDFRPGSPNTGERCPTNTDTREGSREAYSQTNQTLNIRTDYGISI